MKPDIRKQFNETFTDKKYQTYIQFIEKVQGGPLQFRLAETPIFLDKAFTQLLLNAGNSICHRGVTANLWQNQGWKSVSSFNCNFTTSA